MCDFVLVPHQDYIAQLLQLVPSFAVSEEYSLLDSEEHTMTGLVFSAFVRFMETSLENQIIVDECTKAIEHFASSSDDEAQNYLITEVFEGFRRPETSKALLLPNSRSLYDRWIAN